MSLKQFSVSLSRVTAPSGAVVQGLSRVLYDPAEGLVGQVFDDHPGATSKTYEMVPKAPVVRDPAQPVFGRRAPPMNEKELKAVAAARAKADAAWHAQVEARAKAATPVPPPVPVAPATRTVARAPKAV